MFSCGKFCELPLPSTLPEQSRPPPQAAPVHSAPLGTPKMMDAVAAHRPSRGCSNPAQARSEIDHQGMEVATYINIGPVFGEVHHFEAGGFSK